jgi:hypothetical protein
MAFRQDAERYGFLRAAACRVLRLMEHHWGAHLWSVHRRPIYPAFDMPAEHAARFAFRRLDLEDAVVAAQDPALALAEKFVRAAFARGDICMGAFEDGRLVAYVWRSVSHAPVTEGVRIRLLRSSTRYGYKSLVLPAYRGMRLNTSVARFWDHNFVAMGVDEDLGYVALHNLASIRSTLRDPNRNRIGYAGFVEMGKWFWSFRTGRVREYLSLERVAGDDHVSATDPDRAAVK